MAEQRIDYVIYIGVDADEVWRALTSPDVTERYWGGTRIESDWTPGAKIFYRIGDRLTDEHTILEIEPGRRLVHTFRPLFGEYQHEAPSRASIELAANAGVTRLTLRHDGFPPQSKVHAACSVGWPMILSNLKTLLETGAPLATLEFDA